jgi:glucosamine-6-phosphate deaminase
MGMDIIVNKDYGELSRYAASVVIDQVNKKRDSVIVLATGDTPNGMFKELVAASQGGRVDFSGCTFIALDEWVGMGEDDEGSSQYLLQRHLF